MKRIAAGLTLVCIALVVGIVQPWQDAGTAQSERTITVYAYRSAATGTVSEGDDCAVLNPSDYAMGMYGQVQVVDEDGTVLAAHDLSGGTWEQRQSGDGLRCEIEATIDVPDAAFSSVTFDGDTIRTFPADAFPLGPEDWVMISVD